MAQSAKIAALTDELIHSILRFDPETSKQAYKRAKDTATRALRAQQYARTNQFDVQASYIGLDEKFRVLNRDDLADALDKRVKEIYQLPGKRIPEHLSLLLLLSDQPTQKTNVGALELLRPPTPPLDLTWKQILEEDPYSDEELWKDVEYGAGSSEEEEIPTKPAKWNGTPATRGEEEDVYDAEACLAPVGLERLKPIKDAQFWKQRVSEQEDKVAITELQAVRETLFMLAGFPTSLYHVDKQSNNVRVNQKYVLSHMMHRTADSLFSHLTDIGGRLYRLRQWIEQPSSLPLIQTLEAAVRTRLAEYDRMLALLQCKFLVPDTSVTVSLLELREELQTASRPILRLAQLLAEIEPQLLVNPFIHLEILFDQINLAQMTLEKDVFDFLSRIFFECLQIYLKPIRRWMALGELGLNDETFFVFENDSGSEVSSLWHDRFVLRRGKANALRSPTFLQPAALKIFNTGKSVVFLREMGIYGAGFYSSEAEPPLAHETVCGSGGEMPLSPFSELFQAAFQTWISSNYSLASTVLREHLFAEAGLMRILNDFKTLYLGADGSLFQDFADAIFERMDAGQRGWNDRFLLTELARGIFSSALSRTQAERIVVRSARSKTQARSVKGLASLSFEYGLPWPIMNIIQRTSIPIYQQLFTFLLQTYRTKYLVQRISLQRVRWIKPASLRHLSCKLRQRLIWFADTLRSYLTETVICLSAEDMAAAMLKAGDIDDMAAIHITYVTRLQYQALLSENLRPINRAVVQLLDLGVALSDTFIDAAASQKPTRRAKSTAPKSKSNVQPKLPRRKSVVPIIVESDSSDPDGDQAKDDGETAASKAIRTSGFEDGLNHVDGEFERLLPFVIAGLRSVGRVGAEPVWEMLAERLAWQRKGAPVS